MIEMIYMMQQRQNERMLICWREKCDHLALVIFRIKGSFLKMIQIKNSVIIYFSIQIYMLLNTWIYLYIRNFLRLLHMFLCRLHMSDILFFSKFHIMKYSTYRGIATYVYITKIHIYIYVCVCVCACVWNE